MFLLDKVRDVHLEGNRVLTTDELKQGLKLHSGDYYSDVMLKVRSSAAIIRPRNGAWAGWESKGAAGTSADSLRSLAQALACEPMSQSPMSSRLLKKPTCWS